MNKLPKKIAIIGLGLIGGSIFMGLKKRVNSDVEIITVGKNEEIPQDCELIIMATPIFEIIRILNILNRTLRKKTLIIDVGSTKEAICSHAKNLNNENLHFIGTHPMAGMEVAGFSNADPNLFVNKSWVVCPIDKNSEALHSIKSLITILGGKPLMMKASDHDRLVSFASHLSLIAGSILVKTALRQKSRKVISRLASTGFRDTTRLASFSPKIKAEIVSSNKNNILQTLGSLEKEIQTMRAMIQEDDWNKIEDYFNEAKTIRDNWLTDYFS